MTTITPCAFVSQVPFMFQVKRNRRRLAAAQQDTAMTLSRCKKCNLDASDRKSVMTPLRHGKHYPAPRQHVATAMDEATQAMLAVFVSNFLFGLPQSIYNILYFHHKYFSYVIVTSFFFTHLFVDPIVFVYFNRHHRRRVVKVFRFCLDHSPRKEVVSPKVSKDIRSSSTEMTSQ